jgi:hypothetical protein
LKKFIKGSVVSKIKILSGALPKKIQNKKVVAVFLED